MNKKYLIVGVLLVFLVAIYIVPVKQETSDGTAIYYHSQVCTYLKKSGETDWSLIGCSKNLLTDTGKEHIELFLGNQGAGEPTVDWVAVSNGSSYCTNAASLSGETTCCGLERAQGTYSNVGTGNWSIWEEFTVTTEAVNNVNATALYNATSGNFMFACNNFTSIVNLAVSDKLNVSWTLWVT